MANPETADSTLATDWVQLSNLPAERRTFYPRLVFLAICILIFANEFSRSGFVLGPLLFFAVMAALVVGFAFFRRIAPAPELFVPRSAKIRPGESFPVRWRLPSGVAAGELSCYFLGEKVSAMLTGGKALMSNRRVFLRQPIFTAPAGQKEGMGTFVGNFPPESLLPIVPDVHYSVKIENSRGFPRS